MSEGGQEERGYSFSEKQLLAKDIVRIACMRLEEVQGGPLKREEVVSLDLLGTSFTPDGMVSFFYGWGAIDARPKTVMFSLLSGFGLEGRRGFFYLTGETQTIVFQITDDKAVSLFKNCGIVLGFTEGELNSLFKAFKEAKKPQDPRFSPFFYHQMEPYFAGPGENRRWSFAGPDARDRMSQEDSSKETRRLQAEIANLRKRLIEAENPPVEVSLERILDMGDEVSTLSEEDRSELFLKLAKAARVLLYPDRVAKDNHRLFTAASRACGALTFAFEQLAKKKGISL